MMDFILKNSFILKFIKFGIVGFTGMIIDFGMTYLCKEKIKIEKYISNAIGFTTAASVNYYFNRIWTFHSINPAIVTEYSKFFIISLIGLGINTFIIWMLVSKANINFYLSKLSAIGIVIIWNFFANLLYTFVR